MSAATVQMETNLTDLPYGLFQQLAKWLSERENWRRVFSGDCGTQQQPCSSTTVTNPESIAGVYKLSAAEEERFGRMEAPGGALLRQLGNRGQTVSAFMVRLNALAKVHGSDMDRPQLMLGRRFCMWKSAGGGGQLFEWVVRKSNLGRLIWSRPEQILVRVHGAKHQELVLECKVSSFPSPHFEWFRDEKAIVGACGRSMVINRCGQCSAKSGVYRCRVWNRVDEGEDWSAHYRSGGKTYQSELLSEFVDLNRYAQSGAESCDACISRNQLENVYRLATAAGQEEGDGSLSIADATKNGSTTMLGTLVAADKVALIISNRTYAPQMPNLCTPHCDAESLADALQHLQFKAGILQFKAVFASTG